MSEKQERIERIAKLLDTKNSQKTRGQTETLKPKKLVLSIKE